MAFNKAVFVKKSYLMVCTDSVGIGDFFGRVLTLYFKESLRHWRKSGFTWCLCKARLTCHSWQFFSGEQALFLSLPSCFLWLPGDSCQCAFPWEPGGLSTLLGWVLSSAQRWHP